jgi:tRNA pseudouridine55 synthase
VTRKRSYRALDGILLLDKRLGASSNKVLQEVRHLFQAAKAGHTGALDPAASGMLPLCFGEATKFAGFLLDADKRYRVTAKLGERTDTADADGEVIETQPVPEFDQATLATAMASLTGPIQQVPPMYSALKRDGQPLYKLARAGETIERAPRPVTIHAFTLLDRPAPDRLELEVHCSKGTYVRTLVEDLAQALGTVGHVTALRRTAVGGFEGGTLYSLEDLQQRAGQGLAALDACLLPPDAALGAWPRVDLDAERTAKLQRGQVVPAEGPETGVRIYGPDGRFLGIGDLAQGLLTPRRLRAESPGSA